MKLYGIAFLYPNNPASQKKEMLRFSEGKELNRHINDQKNKNTTVGN